MSNFCGCCLTILFISHAHNHFLLAECPQKLWTHFDDFFLERWVWPRTNWFYVSGGDPDSFVNPGLFSRIFIGRWGVKWHFAVCLGMLWTDFNEIFLRGGACHYDQSFRVCWQSISEYGSTIPGILDPDEDADPEISPWPAWLMSLSRGHF